MSGTDPDIAPCPGLTEAQKKFVAEVRADLKKKGRNLDGEMVGRPVFSRNGKAAGVCTAVSRCQLEGCRGLRLHVRWNKGRGTRPCTRGCTYDETLKAWRIE